MKIRISSGEYKGRYVGPTFGGLRTNPTLIKDPEVQVPGTSYFLYVQSEVATNYLQQDAAAQVQAELKSIGLDSELV